MAHLKKLADNCYYVTENGPTIMTKISNRVESLKIRIDDREFNGYARNGEYHHLLYCIDYDPKLFHYWNDVKEEFGNYEGISLGIEVDEKEIRIWLEWY